MRNKNLRLAIIITMAVTLLAFVTTAVSFQNGEDQISMIPPCNPEICHTFNSEDIPDAPLSPDGACDCQTSADDADCHYEFIPAFDCGVDQDDTGNWDFDYYGTDYGIKNEHDGYITVYCNIPTDTSTDSIKYWGDVESVMTYLYHSANEYSSVYVMSSSTAGSTDYTNGSITSSGQRGLLLDVTSVTPNRHWYILVNIQTDTGAALHGFRVCYDPT